jgi:hypothetical protein
MTTEPLPLEIFDDPDDVVDQPVQVEAVQRAVVTGTDWTTETVLSQMRRDNIQLNPRFQRRDAWTQERKSRRAQPVAATQRYISASEDVDPDSADILDQLLTTPRRRGGRRSIV